MGSRNDLQVDTDCIRQSAATLQDAGHRWSRAAPGAAPVLASGALGSTFDAVAVARLVTLRCSQAKESTDQLAAVAVGMSAQLITTADTFDRLEAGLRWPR